MVNKLNATELGYNEIRSNIIDFLSKQEQFRGYDFYGSNMSVIIDILAYNTYYSNLYENFTLNESFLDSASLRNSVVSLGKMLGYVPRSASSARATVNVVAGATSETPDEIRIPQYTPFTTSVNNETFTFYTDTEYFARKAGTNYTFENINIIEGTPVVEAVEYTGNGQRFVIRNANIDVSTLQVSIQPSRTSATTTDFQRAEDLLELNATSNVYFLREIDDGQYEVSFGDGILGRALEAGNIINVRYSISSLDVANKASAFAYNGGRLGNGNVEVVATAPANGGRDREDIESIRYNAPGYYASQNRAVTTSDYSVLLSQRFPFIKTLNVFGGEDNIPAIYGKVFIAVGSQDRQFVTSTQKQEIITYLRNKNVVSVIPEVIDTEYNLIEMVATVHYSPSKTAYTENDIGQTVIGVIENYDDDVLQRFGGVFRYSNLVSQIDNSLEAINSSSITINVVREIRPAFGVNAEYDINFLNPLQEGGLATSAFKIDGNTQDHYLDDANGSIRLFNISDDGAKNIVRNVGTIDYESGIIRISNLNVATANNNVIRLRMAPNSDDIEGNLNQIIEVDRSKITINVIKDNV